MPNLPNYLIISAQIYQQKNFLHMNRHARRLDALAQTSVAEFFLGDLNAQVTELGHRINPNGARQDSKCVECRHHSAKVSAQKGNAIATIAKTKTHF